MQACILIHLLIFVPTFRLGGVAGGEAPKSTRNTSRSTAISNSSAGSTPRQDQVKAGDVDTPPGP